MVPALAETGLDAGRRGRALPRARWRDLAPRVASALVMVPLGLATIFAGGWIWQAVLTGLCVIAMLEWASLCGARPASPLARISVVTLADRLGLPCRAVAMGAAIRCRPGLAA